MPQVERTVPVRYSHGQGQSCALSACVHTKHCAKQFYMYYLKMHVRDSSHNHGKNDLILLKNAR